MYNFFLNDFNGNNVAKFSGVSESPPEAGMRVFTLPISQLHTFMKVGFVNRKRLCIKEPTNERVLSIGMPIRLEFYSSKSNRLVTWSRLHGTTRLSKQGKQHFDICYTGVHAGSDIESGILHKGNIKSLLDHFPKEVKHD